MKAKEETAETPLPESLLRQLRGFEKRLCVMETVVGVLGSLGGILLTYGLLFVSDRLWDTPPWMRVPLTLLGGLALAWFASRWMHHWWWGRRDTRALARLVQKQYSRMGDRLLGAVELANGTSLPQNISPALCRAAIQQVTREAAEYDFRGAVPTRRPRTVVLSFLLLLVAAVASLLLAPEAGCNAMMRWLKPFAPVERYTFVSLESMPDQQVVPHGEDFEIGCHLTEGSRWRPIRATCSIKDQPRIEARVADGKARFFIPGQTVPVVLSIRIGDLSRQITIKPVFRPELTRLVATMRLPDYLQRSLQTFDVENGRVKLLASSHISFGGTISRALTSAGMATVSPDAKRAEHVLNVEANRFTSAEIAADRCDTVVFEWTDGFGLSATEPYVLNVETVQDQPPFVECSGIARAVAMLEDEVLELGINGEDDFGLRELWVNWSSVDSKDRGIPDVQGTQSITNGSPDRLALAGSFSFSPITAHVPEETLVSLCAYAADYLPGRKPAMSLVYRIYVLSRAKHAKLVEQQMEAVQAKLEDLSRDEESLLEENKALSGRDPEALAADKTTNDLKEQEAAEREQAERLARLSDEAEALLKEALRNKEIPEETLRRWAELAASMQQLAGSEMKQAAQALQQAGTRQKERSQKLAEAIALEESILAALREMEQGINASMEDMLAKSFVNRLRTAAAAEQDIAATLGALLPKTVGMCLADLPVDLREQIGLLAARQTQTQKEAAYIRDDLAGFYNRTRLQIYDDIHRDMLKLNMAESLDELAKLISQNVGVQSIARSTSWKEQFVAWAELLEEKGPGGAGGSSEGGAPEGADIEVLIALMRARQREESLREQTRLVDEGQAANSEYTADARRLSKMQYDLAGDIRPLERKVRDPKLRQLIEKVGGEMMNAGMFLRKPQTDSTTVAIETEIIELLSNSISASAGQCGGMAQGVMQAMGMQMGTGMGAGAGPKGGGSSAGGTTDASNAAVAGSVGQDASGSREIEKVGGVDAADLPEEFRDLIEAYFNALEEEK